MADQRLGAIMLRLTALEEATVAHAAQLTGEPPAVWARRELLRLANQQIRRAERRETSEATP